MSDTRKNYRRREFQQLLDRLPREIRNLALAAFRQFCIDPALTSLRHRALKDTGKGAHLAGSFSVSINRQYRAIYFVDGDTNVWYWIGSHADYDVFTGGR